MPADELLALATARVTSPDDDTADWPAPGPLYDRDHWLVYLLCEEFGVPPHPGPAHDWPPALVADLRRARYAVAYARRAGGRGSGVGGRGPIERSLATDDRAKLDAARRARDAVVSRWLAAQRAGPPRRRR
jgi:hypothetical protein